ncbi:MAG: SDR family oxidoreductase [Thermoleophilaceae bacterium]|nr:SDR family oxidoreductase [Thermoleophilaceae bacterium]
MTLPAPHPDSTCLVTGASSGIGADIARELATRGHGLTLVARRLERLEALAEELREKHAVRVETIACDVTDAPARASLMSQVAAAGLRVDVLVNNAGFGSGGNFAELDGEAEVRMVRTNCEAVVALSHAVAGQMVAARSGAILNVASSAGFQPIPKQATYAATKAFALSFSEALSSELGEAGITVTALCPGPVRTEFVEVAAIDEAAEAAPGFLWISSEQCAKAAVEGLERGKRVVIPHAPVRMSTLAARYTPHSILLPLMRRFYPV